MSDQSLNTTQNQLTFFVEDFHVKTSPLPEKGRDLLEAGQDYGSSLLELLTSLNRTGLSSKMSPVFYPATTEQTLPSSFDGWSSAGMAFVGGFLTLNISEWPNAAAVCSLSQVLETDAAQKYYLSPKACAGILRRAAKRGKELPERLRYALESMGGGKGYLGLDDGAMTLGGQTQWVTGTLDAKSCSANRGSQANEAEFIVLNDQGGQKMEVSNNLSGTLRSQEHGHTPIIMATGQPNAEILENQSPTLNVNYEQPIIAFTQEATPKFGDIPGALDSQNGRQASIGSAAGVRRLTPTECARLQGFPDDWNSFQADSSRYKQYGNAVTVNVAEWIGHRIMGAA